MNYRVIPIAMVVGVLGFFVYPHGVLAAGCDEQFDACVEQVKSVICANYQGADANQCAILELKNCDQIKAECVDATVEGPPQEGAGSDAPQADPVKSGVAPKAKKGNWGIDDTIAEAKNGTAIPHTDKDVSGMIALFIKAALSLVATVFFVLMVYAGMLWMTAWGESGQVESAKKIMTAAVVGVVIIAAAYAIVSFIFITIG